MPRPPPSSSSPEFTASPPVCVAPSPSASARLDAAIHPRVTVVSCTCLAQRSPYLSRRSTRLRARVTAVTPRCRHALDPDPLASNTPRLVAWSGETAQANLHKADSVASPHSHPRPPPRSHCAGLAPFRSTRPPPFSLAANSIESLNSASNSPRIEDLQSPQRTWQQKDKTSTSTRSLTASSRVRHRLSPQFSGHPSFPVARRQHAHTRARYGYESVHGGLGH